MAPNVTRIPSRIPSPICVAKCVRHRNALITPPPKERLFSESRPTRIPSFRRINSAERLAVQQQHQESRPSRIPSFRRVKSSELLTEKPESIAAATASPPSALLSTVSTIQSPSAPSSTCSSPASTVVQRKTPKKVASPRQQRATVSEEKNQLSAIQFDKIVKALHETQSKLRQWDGVTTLSKIPSATKAVNADMVSVSAAKFAVLLDDLMEATFLVSIFEKQEAARRDRDSCLLWPGPFDDSSDLCTIFGGCADAERNFPLSLESQLRYQEPIEIVEADDDISELSTDEEDFDWAFEDCKCDLSYVLQSEQADADDDDDGDDGEITVRRAARIEVSPQSFLVASTTQASACEEVSAAEDVDEDYIWFLSQREEKRNTTPACAGNNNNNNSNIKMPGNCEEFRNFFIGPDHKMALIYEASTDFEIDCSKEDEDYVWFMRQLQDKRDSKSVCASNNSSSSSFSTKMPGQCEEFWNFFHGPDHEFALRYEAINEIKLVD